MPKRHSTSRASSSSKAPTSSTSPFTNATGIRTTTTGCSTRSASSRGRTMSASIGLDIAGTSRRTSSSRSVTLADARALVQRAQAKGRVVVFTNGVFDLLHPGHVRYLEQARSLGDILIVGLNSDASVRSNKGVDRPITSQAERAEIL